MIDSEKSLLEQQLDTAKAALRDWWRGESPQVMSSQWMRAHVKATPKLKPILSRFRRWLKSSPFRVCD